MEKFVYGRRKIRFCSSVSGNEPQATKKFFGAAVFQKCCRGVGEQPTFAKQMKLHDEKKQKSKRESEESQLPSKSEGCNERYGFRGNCDSQGKLGMCPSLAESLAVGFSRNHVSRETMYKNKLFLEHWLQILSRRQRNPRAMLLAHGAGGEKRESFSRRGEQDRSAL